MGGIIWVRRESRRPAVNAVEGLSCLVWLWSIPEIVPVLQVFAGFVSESQGRVQQSWQQRNNLRFRQSL